MGIISMIIVGSIVGALLVLFVYGLIRKKA